MRRILLLAAAALLGSGCIVHNDNAGDGGTCSRTITVTWNGFTAGDGAVLSCADAFVAGVDIYMNGQPVSTWACTDGGATITGVQQGSYTLDVEGVESDGRIAFRDEFPVTASACGDTLVHAQPAEGYVDLQYAFASSNVCAPGSFIWFSVLDQVASIEAALVDRTTAPRTYACGDPAGIFFPLPAGPHRLRWVEERVEPTPGTFNVTGANCTPYDFTVQGGRTNAVPVTLVDTTAACPR
jgi:hypothetical protein